MERRCALYINNYVHTLQVVSFHSYGLSSLMIMYLRIPYIIGIVCVAIACVVIRILSLDFDNHVLHQAINMVSSIRACVRLQVVFIIAGL